MQARVHRAVSLNWCSDLMAGDKHRYWRCLGAAGRISNALRRDPDLQSLPAYASEEYLNQDLVHTMCALTPSHCYCC